MTLPIINLEKHISGFSGIGGVLYQPFGVSQDYKLARFPPSMGLLHRRLPKKHHKAQYW